jgi:plasmid stabilization system protein ParE
MNRCFPGLPGIGANVRLDFGNMSLDTTLPIPTEASADPENAPRRHKRVKLALPGRFMRENKQEFDFRFINISIAGADISAEEVPEVGERLVIRAAKIGGLEGRVERIFDGGFAIEISATQRRQEKLAAQLTALLNQHEIGTTDRRRPGHERIRLDRKPITVTFEDGGQAMVAAIDVSISGAKLESEMRPPVDREVFVGKLRSRVVRHHETGFSVEFLDIQDKTAIRRYFG